MRNLVLISNFRRTMFQAYPRLKEGKIGGKPSFLFHISSCNLPLDSPCTRTEVKQVTI